MLETLETCTEVEVSRHADRGESPHSALSRTGGKEMRYKRNATFAVFGLLVMAAVQVMAQQNQEPEPMGFFITSVGPDTRQVQ